MKYKNSLRLFTLRLIYKSLDSFSIFCSTWDTHEDFDNITATVLTNFESNIKFQRNKINMNAYVHDHK